MENKIRTPQEISAYMTTLKTWMQENQNTPAEEMGSFFAARLHIYEDRHLSQWGEEYAHIAEFFDDKMQTLLDLGCGTGLELKAIFARFPNAKVTGIDLSGEMLQKLQENFKGKNLELVRADYTKYPFEKTQYDAALSFETLHHFTYDEKKALYRKIFRALHPGGYYIECDYTACCEEEEALCLAYRAKKRRASSLPDNTWLHVDIPLTAEHQTELMKAAGFQTVKILYQNGSTVIYRAEKADINQRYL